MNADGTSPRLVRRNVSGFADWSPDGRRFALVVQRAGGNHIFVMNVNGGALRRLTKGCQQDYDPAWSPDGRRIAFTCVRQKHGHLHRQRQRFKTSPPHRQSRYRRVRRLVTGRSVARLCQAERRLGHAIRRHFTKADHATHTRLWTNVGTLTKFATVSSARVRAAIRPVGITPLPNRNFRSQVGEDSLATLVFVGRRRPVPSG